MMFEAMAFKFCPIHIKLSTSNSKRGCLNATVSFKGLVVSGSWLVNGFKFKTIHYKLQTSCC